MGELKNLRDEEGFNYVRFCFEDGSILILDFDKAPKLYKKGEKGTEEVTPEGDWEILIKLSKQKITKVDQK